MASALTQAGVRQIVLTPGRPGRALPNRREIIELGAGKMKALRLGAYDSTTGVAIQRALCPVLVGREGELTELEDALLAAIRGEGQVVLLAGDAGMGKTRLATELAERGRQAGTAVLWGVCSEAELALPYLPFLQALGNYLASADMTQLLERLGPLRHDLAHLFPQLE